MRRAAARFVCIGCVLLTVGSASAAEDLGKLRLSRMAAGTAAPSFLLPALDGKPMDSQSLGGKIVLLNFWATWCGPCKEEMPSLQRLQQRFSFEDVRVVAVTTDLQRTGIRQFLERVGATFPALFDEDQVVSQSYMVRGLPTTVLIGRDGKIVGRAVGPRDWDSPEAVSFIKSLAGP